MLAAPARRIHSTRRADATGALLKMRALEAATGVGREAIRFYIREGLLPEPTRPARNVALYDASFIERIRLIKNLQQTRFLPLRVIKAIVDGDAPLAPAEVQTLVDLDQRLGEGAARDRRQPPLPLTVVARRTGVPRAEIRELADAEVLEITSRGGTAWLRESDVRIVELWGKLRAAGFTEARGFRAGDLRLYVDLVRWLAREELRMFTRGVAGRADPQQLGVMAEAAIEILNQLIGVLRRNILLRAIEQGAAPVPARLPRLQVGRTRHRR